MAEAQEHLRQGIALFRSNLRMSKGIRRNLTRTDEDGFVYRCGERKDLKDIEYLQIRIFRKPLLTWMVWLYRWRLPELSGVVLSPDGKLAGYDLFMFNEAEYGQKIVHELFVAVAPEFQGRGISTKLRRFSVECYDDNVLKGVSTLAGYNDIKALRSAQKSGFAITKSSAKPPAYYMFVPLIPRYRP